MRTKAWLTLPAPDPRCRKACWGLGRTWVAPPQLVSWPTQLVNKATPILPGLTGMTPKPCVALGKAWCSVPALTWSPQSQGAA